MDPEEVHDVIVPLMDKLQGVVESFGGTVVNTMGDGFFAVFGAPVAHPDDAERAIRAAFATRAAVRASRDVPAFDLHCGIQTGWVSVAPGRNNIDVVGDTVNTGSRIAGLAPPGVVLVGETTRSLTAGSIRYRELEPALVKGKAVALRVFEALEVRNSALERFFEPAFTPLIGRDDERRRLEAIFASLAEERRSSVAVIAGAPGVGKSRLASEFASSLPDATILVGRGVPFGESIPWLAISNALRGLAGIGDDDSLDVAKEKLWTCVENALPHAPGEQHAQLVAQLGLLLRIDEHAAASRAVPGQFNWEMAAALRRLMTGLAEQRPVVLIVEDLQWADPEVASFLRWVHGEPWEAPVLVLGLVWEDALDSLGFALDDRPVLRLASLGRNDLDALIRFLLPGAGVPEEVSTDLAVRSGGNPLFLQEIVRLLREQGALLAEPDRWVLLDAKTHGVPQSVHLVVAARIDGLEPDERRLLRDAAVCGATFSVAALEALGWRDALSPLASLETRGLVFRRPPASGDEFGFTHTVIRDVAYDSIPRSERAGKHLAVAEFLRTSPDEPIELLAYHFAQAALITGAHAGPDVSSLAVTYLTRAGDRALAQRALREAESWYRQAIELHPPAPARAHMPEGSATLNALLRHADVLFDLSRYDDAREEASRALEMAGIAGNASAHATAYLQIAWHDSLFGEVESARKLLDLADARFREACDDLGRAHVVRALADTYRFSDIARMIEGVEEAARLYEAADDWRNQHYAYEDLAYVHTTHAHSEFERFLRAGEPLVERAGDRRSRAAYLRTQGFHAFYLGRFDDAIAPLTDAMALARDAGDVFVECDCMYVLARIAFNRGSFDRARELGEKLARFGASQGLRRIEEQGLVVLARIASRTGKADGALRMLQRARTLLDEIGADREMVEVTLAEAQIALDRGDWSRAADAAKRYGEAVARFGDVLEESRSFLIQARSRYGAGRWAEADELAAAALALAEAEGQPDVMAGASAIRASALAMLGRHDDAAVFLARSRPGGYPEDVAIHREAEAVLALSGNDTNASIAAAAAVEAWRLCGSTVWLERALSSV